MCGRRLATLGRCRSSSTHACVRSACTYSTSIVSSTLWRSTYAPFLCGRCLQTVPQRVAVFCRCMVFQRGGAGHLSGATAVIRPRRPPRKSLGHRRPPGHARRGPLDSAACALLRLPVRPSWRRLHATPLRRLALLWGNRISRCRSRRLRSGRHGLLGRAKQHSGAMENASLRTRGCHRGGCDRRAMAQCVAGVRGAPAVRLGAPGGLCAGGPPPLGLRLLLLRWRHPPQRLRILRLRWRRPQQRLQVLLLSSRRHCRTT